jgi:ankyrin repeat protein
VLSGIDVNIGDYDGRTALHLAACFGNLELVKYIIEHGIIISDSSNFDMTICLIFLFYILMINYYLGGYKDVMDRFGGSPIHDAKVCGHHEVVKYLSSLDDSGSD